MANDERVEARNVSMYPSQWQAVEQIAERLYEGNISQTLRVLITHALAHNTFSNLAEVCYGAHRPGQ